MPHCLRSEAQLWERHRHRRRRSTDDLILHYAPLVKFVVGRLSSCFPSHVDRTELFNVGLRGLWEAIERFDPDRGIRFESFASRRIRGAVLDELRRIDWMPRSVRRVGRELSAAVERFRHRRGRLPTDSELATEMNVGVPELLRMIDESTSPHFVTWDSTSTGGEGEAVFTWQEVIAAPEELEPELALLLDQALAELPERDRQIIQMHYGDGMVLREIGEHFGISTARVHVILQRSLLVLRSFLSPTLPGMAGVQESSDASTE